MRKTVMRIRKSIVVAALISIIGVQTAQAQIFNVPAKDEMKIDRHNVCRVVKNNGSTAIMVATNISNEWSTGANSFLNNFTDIPNVTVANCGGIKFLQMRDWHDGGGPPGQLTPASTRTIINETGSPQGIHFNEQTGLCKGKNGKTITHSNIPWPFGLKQFAQITDAEAIKAFNDAMQDIQPPATGRCIVHIQRVMSMNGQYIGHILHLGAYVYAD